jgi:hypothetical protein
VTGTLEGEIEISWNPNPEPDLDHYLLERSTAPDFELGAVRRTGGHLHGLRTDSG